MTGYRTLISASELAGRMGEAGWRIFDCRHDLARPESGEAAFREAHIRGAQFLHLDRDLSGPVTGRNGRHPLPDPQQLATRLAQCGVDNDSQVIAYDDATGVFASRLWWLLRWLGHEHVAVLDGGLAAWRDAGLPLSRDNVRHEPARFGYRVRGADAVDVDFVAGHLGSADVLLLDARGADRFRGENETIDPVAGHVPGARNRFFRDNLGGDGRFKDAVSLRTEYRQALGGLAPHQVVHTCGSGVSACHNLLAMEIAGMNGSRLYPGSWSEWCSDPARPIER